MVMIASASDDGTVRLLDIKTNKHIVLQENNYRRMWCVAFSPNGKILASGSGDKILKLWKTETWECITTFDKSNGGHEHWVRTLAFSDDSDLLVSGSWDQTIKLWNISEKRLRART